MSDIRGTAQFAGFSWWKPGSVCSKIYLRK